MSVKWEKTILFETLLTYLELIFTAAQSSQSNLAAARSRKCVKAGKEQNETRVIGSWTKCKQSQMILECLIFNISCFIHQVKFFLISRPTIS